MGRMKGAYKIEFPVGTKVRIADRQVLEEFLRDWKYHNKLRPEQVDFHGRVTKVVQAGFYHGGDELYQLQGIPGIWH